MVLRRVRWHDICYEDILRILSATWSDDLGSHVARQILTLHSQHVGRASEVDTTAATAGLKNLRGLESALLTVIMQLYTHAQFLFAGGVVVLLAQTLFLDAFLVFLGLCLTT